MAAYEGWFLYSPLHTKRTEHVIADIEDTKAIDWKRHDHNIYDKVQDWFRVIKTELDNPAILAENVYDMDETGVLLSVLGALKVLVGREEMCKYRGAAVKRKMVTAVECLSADGRSLNPLVVWPASTHRSNWTTYPTPGWHFACSKNGYTDSSINLYWIQHVFDPQTKARAGKRPRLLINDGFATHESLEVLKFCLANNIIPCRLPSHTSHKLQPCDVGVFSALKTAYREQVELFYRGGANAVRLEHFTSLYSRARNSAITPRNINAGWSKTVSFPWNPDLVLKDIQPPPGASGSNRGNIAKVAHYPASAELLQKPQTPITADGLQSLGRKVQKEARGWDEDSKFLVNRLAHAAEKAFADCALLCNDDERLLAQNNEKRSRTSKPARKVGNAKVMSYEDIIEAQRNLEARKASQAGKRKTNSSSGRRPKRSCSDDVRRAEDEIQSWGFQEYCSIENQISNNRWDEVDIKRIVAIEETGWTNQELNDVTNQFNVILWNCWQNDWPRQKKPYYNPLWWNCHDVAMLFIHLLDISGASDKKLPRIYHLLCRRRRDLQITIESHMLAPSTIASSLQSAIHILSDLGQVTGILGAGAGVGAASLTVSAGGIGFEAAGGALVATNPLLAGICALGLTGFLAIKLYSIINQKASLKMRAKIMACVEEKLPRLKEANQWVESGLTDSEDTLTEGFKLFQQWLATDAKLLTVYGSGCSSYWRVKGLSGWKAQDQFQQWAQTKKVLQ
ncbi:hypothetical protein PENSUB_6110 [Penicillium subrubescens]|uniref:DDE-1 domain-containing protein n=1 Tax=Penicillium subrubescens TaxID=1316194 RepID=A0A1Q5U3U4_9EURO|nr:hypothetical protein PENSUB_6110 [Penicillium subrubescens]